MGTKHTKEKQKIQKSKKLFKFHKVSEEVSCPYCNTKFDDSKTILFNQHMKNCISLNNNIITSCNLYPPSFDYNGKKIGK